MTLQRWEATLDAFASCLAEQERLLAEQRLDELQPFAPATDLGPLPISLAPLAVDLHARSEALTREVGRRTAAAGQQLAHSRLFGRDACRSGASRYLDQMA